MTKAARYSIAKINMEFSSRIKRLRELRALASANKDLIKKISNAVSKANTLATKSGCTFQCYPSDTPVSLAITVTKAKSFKDEWLQELLSDLIDIGMSVANTDYPENMNRDFYASIHGAGNLRIGVMVCVYVNSSSPVCRRIPIRSTMVEKVEYQIVCD